LDGSTVSLETSHGNLNDSVAIWRRPSTIKERRLVILKNAYMAEGVVKFETW